MASSQTKVTYPDLKIGFFGYGNMYKALSNGFVNAGRVKPENILASNLRQAEPEKTLPSGMVFVNSNRELVRRSNVVVISVKPHLVRSVMEEVQQDIHQNNDQLFVSIAAGLTIAQLEAMLPKSARLVRTMPNTPTQVGMGVTVFTAGTSATQADVDLVQSLFSSVGLCESVPEKHIDAVVGVSGSGPAYAFLAIEALSDGGVKMGLPRDLSTKLAAQMLMGAGKMVLETGKHPGQLKDGVCSPGGTTIHAVHTLEKRGFRAALTEAVEVATTRAAELGKQ